MKLGPRKDVPAAASVIVAVIVAVVAAAVAVGGIAGKLSIL
jgi:hypothetical protein